MRPAGHPSRGSFTPKYPIQNSLKAQRSATNEALNQSPRKADSEIGGSSVIFSIVFDNKPKIDKR